MKAVLQICMVIFMAVTFGDAQQDVNDAIDDCYVKSYSEKTTCRDQGVSIPCLKKIHPRNDVDKERIEQAIVIEKAELTSCPGLTKDSCIHAATSQCVSKVLDLYKNSDKEACNEAKKAMSCLIKFNSTCIKDVISFDYSTMKEFSDKCDKGHYDDKNCFKMNPAECTIHLLTKYGYETGFACEPEDVSTARKCLMSWQAKCTTKHRQDEIQIVMDSLNRLCPSSN